MELATEGLSLLNDGARELRADAMSAVSEMVCRCMATGGCRSILQLSALQPAISTQYTHTRRCLHSALDVPDVLYCYWMSELRGALQACGTSKSNAQPLSLQCSSDEALTVTSGQDRQPSIAAE
tara:strand:- start:39620 stop:39991 length:372 start_codon:yes stop_codon:yes gene_type:complete